MTAQPSRPVARYRPGKATQQDSSEEEDSEEEQTARAPKRPSTQRSQPQKPAPKAAATVDSDEEGFETDEQDEGDGSVDTTPAKTADPSQQRILPQRSSETEEESEDGSGSESGSEESDASFESDTPARKFQRPTFVKKSDRTTTAKPNTHEPTPAAVSATPHSEDIKSRRLAETDFQISEKINRDNIARAAGRKAWDDDDAFDPSTLVDDTDGLDPAAEHAAWRLRELQRLKRDREQLIAKEKETEEVERRRNLTAAEREAEDRVHLDKQREEKEGRGQTGFLARYHHKGAFFQDSAEAEELKKRDVMGARFEDEVDKSALPEYMRIRDMNKLGKKGRSRYKDLRNEDTGAFANDVKHWKGAMGAGGDRREGNMDYRDVDERFLPDDDRRGGGPMSSGANNAPLGPRKERRKSRSRSRSRSPRRDDGESYRPQRRRSYSRSRSRSRSPARRKRSPSGERYRDDDKRRRVDVR